MSSIRARVRIDLIKIIRICPARSRVGPRFLSTLQGNARTIDVPRSNQFFFFFSSYHREREGEDERASADFFTRRLLVVFAEERFVIAFRHLRPVTRPFRHGIYRKQRFAYILRPRFLSRDYLLPTARAFITCSSGRNDSPVFRVLTDEDVIGICGRPSSSSSILIPPRRFSTIFNQFRLIDRAKQRRQQY